MKIASASGVIKYLCSLSWGGGGGAKQNKSLVFDLDNFICFILRNAVSEINEEPLVHMTKKEINNKTITCRFNSDLSNCGLHRSLKIGLGLSAALDIIDYQFLFEILAKRFGLQSVLLLFITN